MQPTPADTIRATKGIGSDLSGKRHSIVLVNYRSRRITAICLELIRTHINPADVDVVVVDNDSCDDSTEYLRQLDWIRLVERRADGPEKGFEAHGRALDLALAHVQTRAMVLFHTDTLLYDPRVIDVMLEHLVDGTAAVGTIEQVSRPWYSSAWRVARRGTRYMWQSSLLALGLRQLAPRPWRERHLKSFCSVWDTAVIRREGLQFSMGILNPGYVMQDELEARGYRFVRLSPSWVFRHLDHVQSGTVVELGRHEGNRRRTEQYRRLMSQFDAQGN